MEYQLAEFVVTREFSDKEYESVYKIKNIEKSKLIGQLYELIDQKYQNFQGKMRIFKLYKLKDRELNSSKGISLVDSKRSNNN